MPCIHPIIVGGQGTYRDGLYYTEYPDRQLCLKHMMAVGDVARELKYNHVICSGGPTKRETPGITEAQSFANFWDETDTKPVGIGLSYDHVALDSAENIIFGLMRLRMDVGKGVRFGRIGFFSLWWFKKPRMNGLAAQLGIMDKFYFHGFAHANVANAGEQAVSGERRQVERIAREGDFVQQRDGMKQKRSGRYCGTDYERRTIDLRSRFKETFRALDDMNTFPISCLPSASMEMDVFGIPEIVQTLLDSTEEGIRVLLSRHSHGLNRLDK